MQAFFDATDVTVLLSKKVERTQKQRMALLVKAKILDEKGNYLPEFFSAETIRRDKAHRLEK